MDSDIKGLFEREPEEMVIEIEIERLRDFKNHPFKVIDDEKICLHGLRLCS